jgi:hypothetical protein
MTHMPDIITRTVRLEGFTPIMFDRYAGDNTTQLPPEQKMYFLQDKKTLCIPAANISSFLSAKNTSSVAKVMGGRAYKKLAEALLGYVLISPMQIPLYRDGESIVFNGFISDVDKVADIYVDRRVARLKDGIPNPKARPVVNLPWEITFTLRLLKNDMVSETMLKSFFEKGGAAIGLGTYRGVFGKFVVVQWE